MFPDSFNPRSVGYRWKDSAADFYRLIDTTSRVKTGLSTEVATRWSYPRWLGSGKGTGTSRRRWMVSRWTTMLVQTSYLLYSSLDFVDFLQYSEILDSETTSLYFQGWTYAVDFPATYSTKKQWKSCVRRRKWVRYRRYSAMNSWCAIAPLHKDATKVDKMVLYVFSTVFLYPLRRYRPGRTEELD